MNSRFWIASLVSVVILPGLLLADPWKDESGHGRRGYECGWGEHFQETPAWARGKGYWDGHFKHRGPPAYGRPDLPPPAWPQQGFYPRYFPPMPYGPVHEGDWEDHKEWSKQRKEWLKELRKEEKEARKQWREWERERFRSYRPPPPAHPYGPW